MSEREPAKTRARRSRQDAPGLDASDRPVEWLAVWAAVWLTGLLTLSAPHAGAAEPAFPALTGRVVDQAGMLSADIRRSLGDALAAHEQTTGQQVVVVTLHDLDGMPIRTYGYQLGRHWGIGRSEHDDGVLLIVAQAERQIGIEVGYGLEGTLTDALAWDVIQTHMMPEFRRGDFEAGIIAGTRAILAALAGEPGAAPPSAPPAERSSLGGLLFWIVIIFILARALGGGRNRRKGMILIGGRHGGHGGGFGGGFGGGGFGGGGGSFGGGGASGGW